jgi:predicted transcriptional regulator
MARGGTNGAMHLIETDDPYAADLLISLRTPYAERIYSGDKRYEFRRVRMNAQPGQRVLIYESYPVKRVKAAFTIGPNSRLGISALEALALEKPGAARRDLAVYLQGARTVSALEITDLHLLDARELGEATGLVRAPQSYCSLR